MSKFLLLKDFDLRKTDYSSYCQLLVSNTISILLHKVGGGEA